MAQETGNAFHIEETDKSNFRKTAHLEMDELPDYLQSQSHLDSYSLHIHAEGNSGQTETIENEFAIFDTQFANITPQNEKIETFPAPIIPSPLTPSIPPTITVEELPSFESDEIQTIETWEESAKSSELLTETSFEQKISLPADENIQTFAENVDTEKDTAQEETEIPIEAVLADHLLIPEPEVSLPSLKEALDEWEDEADDKPIVNMEQSVDSLFVTELKPATYSESKPIEPPIFVPDENEQFFYRKGQYTVKIAVNDEELQKYFQPSQLQESELNKDMTPETENIIARFLQNEPHLSRKRPNPKEANIVVQLPEKAEEEEEEEEIVTEAMARLYLVQGDKNAALEIYHKLCLLFPEKSDYFATFIEDIRNKR